MLRFFIVTFFISMVIISCDKINTGLTNAQVIEGLKSALIVGTDTSVAKVSKVNGYYGDAIIKIFLPPDANVMLEYLSYIPGGDQLVQDVILRINRAAEDAAVKATPIFVDAVTSMTITDAFNILHGDDTAATHYLRQTTWTSLYQLFQPDINTSLDKPLVAGVSANESWNTLTTAYNDNVVNTIVGQIAGLTPVTTGLSNYSTGRALDGLFYKIGEEEKDIRNDPAARINDILKQVFGSLD
jgi:hypothetical protein